MFFRLPKNTIKNLHFGPFGGGSPPSPPPPLNTASAYVFLRKSSKIYKKPLKPFYLSPSGWALHVRACEGGPSRTHQE